MPVHVPEYSPERPETVARHAPSQDRGDLLADQPPCIRTLPVVSWSIHPPVAPPLGSACAVQLPPRYPDCAVALQVPLRSAPEARRAVAASIAKTRLANIVLNLSCAASEGLAQVNGAAVLRAQGIRLPGRRQALGQFNAHSPWVGQECGFQVLCVSALRYRSFELDALSFQLRV